MRKDLGSLRKHHGKHLGSSGKHNRIHQDAVGKKKTKTLQGRIRGRIRESWTSSLGSDLRLPIGTPTWRMLKHTRNTTHSSSQPDHVILSPANIKIRLRSDPHIFGQTYTQTRSLSDPLILRLPYMKTRSYPAAHTQDHLHSDSFILRHS